MRSARGITLIEMLVVVALISLVVGLSYPGVSKGLEGIRLRMSADDVASFLSLAMNRVDRTESPVVLRFLKAQGALEISGPSGPPKMLKLPDGISIAEVYPLEPGEPQSERSALLLPGGSFPRLIVELASRGGARRSIRVDPVTGTTLVEGPVQPLQSKLESR